MHKNAFLISGRLSERLTVPRRNISSSGMMACYVRWVTICSLRNSSGKSLRISSTAYSVPRSAHFNVAISFKYKHAKCSSSSFLSTVMSPKIFLSARRRPCSVASSRQTMRSVCESASLYRSWSTGPSWSIPTV